MSFGRPSHPVDWGGGCLYFKGLPPVNPTHGRLERPGSTYMMPHINIFLHPYTDRSLCHTQLDHEHLYVCVGTDGKCG